MSDAIYAVTATLQLVTSIVEWADPLFNPLNANAGIITYLVDLGVVVPLAFMAIRSVIGLASRRRRA